MASLEALNFDNLTLRSLPVEQSTENYVRRVSGACFSRVPLAPVDNPVMVAFSTNVAKLLDLPKAELERPEAALYFSGSKLFNGSEPAAHCYCGHQFGYFAGQLGDGAAMYLGEVINQAGERWEVQLKGAGPTPYSREADGRKVLRSSIREFLCSEAMHHLGIPTTRALTCVTSDSRVVRDIFYDGHPIMEKCTIVCRVAPTFIRFGSFEIFKTLDAATGRVGPSVGRVDILEKLLHYTISTFYKEIYTTHIGDPQKMYAEFFKEVIQRTARTVADWQCVGFCHGVLNTDNMSVVGVTIDYGPFGFMDYFNPDHICNTSDDGGRYSYINQPKICAWNLKKFAEALQPLFPLDVSLKLIDEEYSKEYNRHYYDQMRRKFGLVKHLDEEDRELVISFLHTMEVTGTDFTNGFRGLSKIALPGCAGFENSRNSLLQHLVGQCCSLEELKFIYRPSMDDGQFKVFVALLAQHPEILEQLGKGAASIQREVEKREKLEEIEKTTAEEKLERDTKAWSEWLEKYEKRLQREAEGSEDVEALNQKRVEMMNRTNPKYVLRNYIAQAAIEAAEQGDFSEVNKVLNMLTNPFRESIEDQPPKESTSQTEESSCENNVAGVHTVSCYDAPPPKWARGLKVSCSS